MKRNIVPLLGIAVVVAILSTAVFYGLFAGKLHSASQDVAGQPIVVAAQDLQRGTVLKAQDLKISQVRGTLEGSFASADQLAGATLVAAIKKNEPVLEERVVSSAAKPGSPGGLVPAGARAVSIRVSESDGLIAFLRPGARVDLQAVAERNGAVEARTILQNIEVVSASSEPQAGGNRGPVSVVTVLTRPEDVDLLAVADSGARLRLSLRNPLDPDTAPRRSLSLPSVFQQTAPASAPVPAAPLVAATGVSAPETRSVQLSLRVLRSTSTAASELQSKLAHAPAAGAISVVPFNDAGDQGELIQKLAAQHELEILSEHVLTASRTHPGRFRTGPASGKLRVSFFTDSATDGRLSLRVQPEISVQGKSGVETRLFDTTVPASGSFLVSGILSQPGDRERLRQLYPGSWERGQLLIVVTAREDRQASAARHQER
jgi:pilus assembly protein CpaB